MLGREPCTYRIQNSESRGGEAIHVYLYRIYHIEAVEPNPYIT